MNNFEPLSDRERVRYSRHLLLDTVGERGQLALKHAHVCVVGCGGLGSPALFYLAAAGVGTLTFIDDDEVELSNLQRQILYKLNHLGQSKAKAAGKVLTSLNNQVSLHPITARLDEKNIASCLESADVILDCSDNFATRYLLNKYCINRTKILVSGAAIGSAGQVMHFDFRQASPCYACLFPESSEHLPLNCDNYGVMGPLLGVIGSMQALLAVNYILGHTQGSGMRQIDGLNLSVREFQLRADPQCVFCAAKHK